MEAWAKWNVIQEPDGRWIWAYFGGIGDQPVAFRISYATYSNPVEAKAALEIHLRVGSEGPDGRVNLPRQELQKLVAAYAELLPDDVAQQIGEVFEQPVDAFGCNWSVAKAGEVVRQELAPAIREEFALLRRAYRLA